ncbi:DMT family transporter [Candidatus Woesearchaeota archaeon]|nr:DMT family transporter [Candidatus Woesearchaeota archaeon]
MRKGVLLALTTAMISGVSIFINKFGVSGINPSMFTFLKNLIVGIFLFSIIVLFKKFSELKQLKRNDWLKLFTIGLIGGSIPFLLFFNGLKLTSAISASFIHKTLFIWVTLLAALFLKEKINKTYILGAGLLVIANFLLLSIKSFTIGLGEIMIFAATLLWSAEVALSKYILKDLSFEVVVFGRMFFGSIFILIYLGFTNTLSFNLSFAQINWVLITSTFLFFYVFTFYAALKLEKASIVTPILLLGSFVTFALNSVYLGNFMAFQWIGSIVMLMGLYLILKNQSAFSIAKKKWM